MKYSTSILATLATLFSTISGHGMLTSPTPRVVGAAMKEACGQQLFYQQTSDSYGNIQGEIQGTLFHYGFSIPIRHHPTLHISDLTNIPVAASQSDYNAATCNVWQCKGYKYADNTANVQSWSAGQVVAMTFDVRAPHTGYANVSIINTATNSIIGDMLLVYDDFADNSKAIPANETSFSITIPSNLGSTCSVAGACVVQHYWNAKSIDQTYESCIDFTVGGSNSGSTSSSTVGATSSSVATSSATSLTSTSLSTTFLSTTSLSSTSLVVVEPTSSSSSTLNTSSAKSASTTFSIVTSFAAAPTSLKTVSVPSFTVATTASSESAVAIGDAGDDDECDDEL